MKAFVKSIGVIDNNNKCHDVCFTSGVNIITGKSSTGKSAIIEIFDYCMGSSDYTVPAGIITDNAYIYFCIIQFEKYELVLARRPEESLVYLNDSDELPLTNIRQNGKSYFSETLFYSLTEFKKICGENFGLVIVDTDEDENKKEIRKRKKERPSIRNVTSYILQHQNLIANKQALFYRFDEYQKRMQTIDQLKIFLGFVDAEYFIKKQRLAQLERDLKNISLEESRLKLRKENEALIIKKYLDEYKAIAGAELWKNITPEDVCKAPVTYLKEIRKHKLGTEINSDIFGKRQEELREEEDNLLLDERKKMAELAAINTSIRYANDFLQKQQPPEVAANIANNSVCPFCHTKHSTLFDQSANKLTEAIEWLNGELGKTSQILDSFVAEQKAIQKKLKDIREKIEKVKSEQNDLSNSITEAEKQRSIRDQIVKLVLRIEIALENLTEKKDQELSARKKQLEKEKVAVRKELADKYNVEKKLEEAQYFLIDTMNALGEKFPFEDSYKPVALRFDFETFDLWFEKDGNKIYLRSMGSGANWLYCHLCLFLAFNKLFCKYSSKCIIPPILFIDQPSQVYFPTQVDTDNEFNPQLLHELSKRTKTDDDIEAVTNLYDQLCSYVKQCESEFGISPQIIITDHADNLKLKNADYDSLVAGRRWRTRGFIE